MPPTRYEFESFVFSPDQLRLWGPEGEIELRWQVAMLLKTLLEANRSVVSKDDLFAAVWLDVAEPAEGLLAGLVKELRKALGDKARRIVQVRPKRGYLIGVPITVRDIPVQHDPDAQAPAESPRPEPFVTIRDRRARAEAIHELGDTYWARRRPDLIDEAIRLYNDAADADPTFANAYASGALAVVFRGFGFHEDDPNLTMPKAKALAERALRLDPSLERAHLAIACVLALHDYSQAEAGEHFARAVDLAPGSALAHHLYANWLATIGRHDESVAEIEIAVRLDPSAPMTLATRVQILYFARRNAEAIEIGKRLLSERRFVAAHCMLADAYTVAGDFGEALRRYQDALELDRLSTVLASFGHALALAADPRAASVARELRGRAAERYVSPYLLSLPALGAGDREEAIRQLELGADGRSEWMPHINVDPRFDPLRGDPRFRALLRRIGLAPDV